MSMPEQLEHSAPYALNDKGASSFPTSAVGPVVRRRETLSVELSFSRVAHSPEQSLPHVLFSPMHYEPGYAYPLIVWLHGAGSDERQVMRVMPIVSMRNYVAVAPRGVFQEPVVAAEPSHQSNRVSATRRPSRPVYAWPQTPEAIERAERAVFECIDIASQRCNVARQRVFLVGFDDGGTMALRLATLYPDYFGGVVSLCGSFPQGDLPLRQWTAIRSLPTLLTVGERSDVFSPLAASQVLSLYHTAGMPIAIRPYPCGQELAPDMLQEVNRWIMERVCG